MSKSTAEIRRKAAILTGSKSIAEIRRKAQAKPPKPPKPRGSKKPCTGA